MRFLCTILAAVALSAATPAAASTRHATEQWVALRYLGLEDWTSGTNRMWSSMIRRDASTITSPGVVTDYVASSLYGGVRVRFSSMNLDNYTAYAYSGVGVRRQRETDDWLWSATDPKGIVRRAELDAFVEATNRIARARAALDGADMSTLNGIAAALREVRAALGE